MYTDMAEWLIHRTFSKQCVPRAIVFSLCIAYFLILGECMLLGSVSSQQRFGVTDIKALGVSQLSGLGKTVL